ncbi:MAG TPA: hypothetical protein VHS05_01765 [Pyrinomonadaceae bacterium]|jgi:hypothetical protein|nr:hypothetical protein [Pyrinomonadaceae bacterium]
MRRLTFVLGLLLVSSLVAGSSARPKPVPAQATNVSVYGAWHCGSDFCTWASVRNMTDFDTRNHWLIDRGDGSPSVNLVVLSFVQPLKLLNKTNDAGTALGVPIGMNSAVVNYFKSHGIRVQLSIGGITYVDAWNQALATNPTQLGLNAAAVAQQLGVGIEIDYEENTNPNLTGLQAFINAYRSVLPYDASGNNQAARLTIDLASGDRWLIALCRKATADWLNTTTPVLDYANAMVASKQFNSASAAQADWQEHIDGKAQYAPPILPLAPAKFTGSLYIVTGTRAAPECTSFSSSLINSTGLYVQTVAPHGAGTTNGMLGYMFWAAECPSTRRVCTVPPDSCEGGVGVGADTYNIPIPMAALRQN